METYLIKSSIALTILYVAYRIIVSYTFDHQLNRLLGLASVIFSVSFSCISFQTVFPSEVLAQRLQTIVVTASDLEKTVSIPISENGLSIFLIVYFCGVTIFAIRLLIGLTSLFLLYLHSTKEIKWGFRVVKVERDVSPFTFFNLLFVGNTIPEGSEIDTIVLHEKIHRDHFHTLDAVLLEILTVLFWFHPAMWLFRREIKAEHEYFADQQVLRDGINPATYQELLFKSRTGVSIHLGNALSNRTSLTKRFIMMTNTKTNSALRRLSSASFLIFLMGAIVVFSAFSSRTDSQVDKVAEYAQGNDAMYKLIREKILYPKSAREKNRVGLVNVTFTINKNGEVENPSTAVTPQGHVLPEVVVAGYSKYSEVSTEVDEALKAEGIRVVASLGKFIPAQKDGKPVSSVLTLPIKFKLE